MLTLSTGHQRRLNSSWISIHGFFLRPPQFPPPSINFGAISPIPLCYDTQLSLDFLHFYLSVAGKNSRWKPTPQRPSTAIGSVQIHARLLQEETSVIQKKTGKKGKSRTCNHQPEISKNDGPPWKTILLRQITNQICKHPMADGVHLQVASTYAILFSSDRRISFIFLFFADFLVRHSASSAFILIHMFSNAGFYRVLTAGLLE